MKIVATRPPNYEAIVKVFPGAASAYVIFAYAPNIYAPGGSELHPALLAHEAAHIKRQEEVGVEAWWDKYLVDGDFRYEEELIAHRAEYEWLEAQATTRQLRRQFLRMVAKKLAADLYGKMVTVEQAMKAIKG